MRRWMIPLTGLAVALIISVVALAADPAVARQNGPGVAAGATTTLTVDDARSAVTAYLADAGITDLEVGEVITFTSHTYVAVVDPTTGDGAIELIVDPTGVVHPQRTLMWNTTYHAVLAGHEPMNSQAMGGMMQHGQQQMSGSTQHGQQQMDGAMQHNQQMAGGQGMMQGGMMGQMNQQSASCDLGTMDQTRAQAQDQVHDPAACQQATGPAATGETLDEPLTADTARTAVQAWLDDNDAGATAGDVTTFPGYFTFTVTSDGAVSGLISVQATTGAVMPQAWHGTVAE